MEANVGVAIAPVVLVHGGAGSIPQSMNEDKFAGMLKKKIVFYIFFKKSILECMF